MKTANYFGYSDTLKNLMPITYSKAVQYATLFTTFDLARDLVHDLYLTLIKRKIDLFQTSKRFCYVALYNYNRSSVVNGMQYRHKVIFNDIAESYDLKSYSNPHESLVAKELYETFSTELTLNIAGYTNKEIGQMTGFTGQRIGQRLKEQKFKLNKRYESNIPI
jgi:hypothetical protein